ncbi:putative ribonuclease H-like domain-containing protein [Tanacetum coccineum]
MFISRRAAPNYSINKLSTGRSSISTTTTPYVSAASTPTVTNTEGLELIDLPSGKRQLDQSFVDPAHPNKVYKVIKALYGLHQAPRAWYETLSSFLMENGFRRGTIDKTLFIKKKKSDIMLFQVYVDDIIFGSTKKSMCTEFEDCMHKRFQMSSMGELTFFLGLQVKQQPDGIFISQDKYVADILKKFDFWSIRTATTPIESNKPLVKDEDGEDVDVHVYRSMIGSLMYLTASRPDIMFAVLLCLWYPRDSPFELEAFSDSDYGGASLDRKSTTGGCQFLGRRLISWQCKKQTIVANSTTEAEYVAAANCCGQVLWIQNQMMDYGFNFMNTKIHIDNESTISVIKNPVAHSRTKHIEIRFHFIRDCYKKRLIEVIKIHTDSNVADLLTKGDLMSQDLTFWCSKKTAWDQFSSNIATTLICLATSRRFNFSKFIFEAMVKNLDSPHSLIVIPGVCDTLFERIVGTSNDEGATASHQDHIFTLSPISQPLNHHSLPRTIQPTHEAEEAELLIPHDFTLHDVHHLEVLRVEEEVHEKPSDETEVIVQEKTPTKIIEEYGSGEKGKMEISTASPLKVTKNNQQDWEIVSGRLYEACGVCILELKDRTIIYMLVERRYPLSKELLQRMLDLGLEVEEESITALHLTSRIDQSRSKRLLDQTVPVVQKQTAFGKDKSNPLIVDNLLKTIRLSIHLVVYNEELAIPEQTTTGKGISNPLNGW